MNSKLEFFLKRGLRLAAALFFPRHDNRITEATENAEGAESAASAPLSGSVVQRPQRGLRLAAALFLPRRENRTTEITEQNESTRFASAASAPLSSSVVRRPQRGLRLAAALFRPRRRSWITERTESVKSAPVSGSAIPNPASLLKRGLLRAFGLSRKLSTTRCKTVAKFLFVLVVLTLSFSSSGSNQTPVTQAQDADAAAVMPSTEVSIDFRTFVKDLSLQEAVFDAMRTKPSNLLIGSHFAVTSERIEGDWRLISIASLDGPRCSIEYVGSGDCGGLILATTSRTLGSQAALAGTQAFSRLMSSVPESFVSSEGKLHLDPLRVASLAVGDEVVYEFPWPPGAWEYRQGWHDQALDIGTHGSDKRALAAADGYITYICRGELSDNITINHGVGVGGRKLEYFHFDKSLLGLGIEEGEEVLRGQILGSLRPDTWSWDGCGLTDQLPDSAHLHWVIPLSSGETFTVDGWTIKYADSTWMRGDQTVIPKDAPYQTLTSTNFIVLPQYEFFDVPFSYPGGWPYLLAISDYRVRRITVDGTFNFWPDQSGCSAVWFNASQGSHEIKFWYEYRDRESGWPTVNVYPYPISPPTCAAFSGDPPPVSPTPTPTSTTPGPTPTVVPPGPTPTLPPGVDGIELVNVSSHVVRPGEQFYPSVTIRRTSGYLDHARGDHLHAIPEDASNTLGSWPVQEVKSYVGTGGTYTFDVNNDSSFVMTAPSVPGQYQSVWQMRVGGNHIGPQAIIRITVQSDPIIPTPTPLPVDCNNPPEGITLYEFTDFRGRCINFTSDVMYLGNTYFGDDVASSLKIVGNWGVTLFPDPDWNGQQWQEFSSSDANLGDDRIGDNRASSLRAWRPGDPCATLPQGVTLYRGRDFTGISQSFSQDAMFLGNERIGDNSVNSLRICGNYRVRLYPDPDWNGQPQDFTAPGDSNLSDDPINDPDPTASSLRIIDASDPCNTLPDGVTLYTQTDFNGLKETFSSDVMFLGNTLIGNDAARSLRVCGHWVVTLFRDPDWTGPWENFTGIDGNLTDNPISSPNPTASSLRMVDSFDFCRTLPPGVTLYRGRDFTGIAQTFTSDVSFLGNEPIGDNTVNSLRLCGYNVRLYRDPDWQGFPEEFTGREESNLSDNPINDPNATTSSIRVWVKPPPPPTPTPTPIPTPTPWATKPDVVPFQGVDWPFPVIPSSAAGSRSVYNLYAGAITYLDWGIFNNSSVNVDHGFSVTVYLDSVPIIQYPFDGINAYSYTGFDDWPVVVASSGYHTFKIVVDDGEAVSEVDENNNSWEGQFYWTPTNTPLSGVRKIFLPLVIYSTFSPKPDLVSSFSLSAPNPTAGQPVVITAIVTNTGTASASNFWVDFYINPSSPPTQANQTWDTRCGMTSCYGIAWYVTQTLAPGESIVLTSTPDSYEAVYTRWPGWFASGTTDLYLYVDTYSDDGSSSGAVLESNETNNRAEWHGLNDY